MPAARRIRTVTFVFISNSFRDQNRAIESVSRRCSDERSIKRMNRRKNTTSLFLYFEVNVTGQRGGLIPEKHDPARFRKRQAGLDRSSIESDLAEDLAVRFVLRIQDRGFRQKTSAPAERKDAASACFADLAQPGLQLLHGGSEHG